MNKTPLEKLFFSKTRDFLDLYLSSQCSKSKHTIKAYRDALTVFRKYVVEVRKNSIKTFTFDDCTREFILDFMEHLQKTGLTPNTCNHRLAALKAYMWYVSDGDISLQQTAIMVSHIPFLKVPEKNKELLSEECLTAMLAAPKANKIGIRDTTIMVLLYDTAIRLSELIELNISSIVFDAPIPYLRIHGKGDKERIVSFTSKTAQHLKNYISIYHKHNDYKNRSLFYTTIHGVENRMSPGNIERIINKYAGEIRLSHPELPSKVHPHMFRRTRATSLYQNNVSLELVSRMLGHSSTQTTRVYARPSVEMLKDAIEKSPYISPDEQPLWLDDEDELAKLCGLR
jgi:integrase/recombinase XerD